MLLRSRRKAESSRDARMECCQRWQIILDKLTEPHALYVRRNSDLHYGAMLQRSTGTTAQTVWPGFFFQKRNLNQRMRVNNLTIGFKWMPCPPRKRSEKDT